MPEERRPTPPPPEPRPRGDTPPPEAGDEASQRDRMDRGLSDFVRRAVSAGIDAATRGKDDVVRIATNEIRGWLDRLDLDREIIKALARMTVEIKAEIKFKEREGDEPGLEVESSELRVRTPSRSG